MRRKGHRETKSQVPHNYGNQVDRKSNISCKICGKAHQTYNCWHSKSKRVSACTEIALSAEFNSPNQGGNCKIGVAIGIEAVIITVRISQLPVGIPIGTKIKIKSTIRSTFVK